MKNYKACKNGFEQLGKKRVLDTVFLNIAHLTILLSLVALVIIDPF